jgi:thiamine kinase-like enzyme
MANLNKSDLLAAEKSNFNDLEKLIESAYNLKILKTYYPNSVSFTSRKAVLETNKGKMFLKEKPFYCSDEISLQRSALFQNYCSKENICPEIIKGVSGEFYFNFENRKFFLSKHIDGRHFNGSKQDIEKMLKIVSKLNIAGKNFLNQEGLPDFILEKYDSYQIATLIPELTKYIKNSKDKNVFEKVQKTFESLKNEYMLVGNKEYVMSHSDCILFNFIFTENSAYIIDFDNAKVLPRIHDFAEFFISGTILNYLAAITNLKKPVLLTYNKEFSNTILNFYKKNLNFSQTDILLFPIIADIVWIWTLCLSVLKEDYSIEDLGRAVEIIDDKEHRQIISSLLS